MWCFQFKKKMELDSSVQFYKKDSLSLSLSLSLTYDFSSLFSLFLSFFLSLSDSLSLALRSPLLLTILDGDRFMVAGFTWWYLGFLCFLWWLVWGLSRIKQFCPLWGTKPSKRTNPIFAKKPNCGLCPALSNFVRFGEPSLHGFFYEGVGLSHIA